MRDNPGSTCYAPPSPHLDPWCSGPTCQPVTLEIAGSNPVGSAINPLFPTPRPPARTGRSLPASGPATPGRRCRLRALTHARWGALAHVLASALPWGRPGRSARCGRPIRSLCHNPARETGSYARRPRPAGAGHRVAGLGRSARIRRQSVAVGRSAASRRRPRPRVPAQRPRPSRRPAASPRRRPARPSRRPTPATRHRRRPDRAGRPASGPRSPPRRRRKSPPSWPGRARATRRSSWSRARPTRSSPRSASSGRPPRRA